MINRSQLYYNPIPEKHENLKIITLMDAHNKNTLMRGVLGMQNMLENHMMFINHKRIRRLMRLMRLMDIKAIYPRKNLTAIAKGEYKYPYLLRNMDITKRNQVWSIDITYIAMEHGFMHLTEIIDVYSRFIVGWCVGKSLEANVSLGVQKEAVARYGKPEIVNSDQGCQYTSKIWTEYPSENEIQISMDRCVPLTISGLNDSGERFKNRFSYVLRQSKPRTDQRSSNDNQRTIDQ